MKALGLLEANKNTFSQEGYILEAIIKPPPTLSPSNT